MDLCRDILIYVESLTFKSQPQKVQIDNYTDEEIQYHIKLLNQAGLIDAENISKSTQETSWRVHSLTWNGHEFVEASRNNSRWQEAKEIMKKNSVGMAFDTIKAVLISLAKEALGL
ncbi:MAG: hypothetical protein JWQ09_4800 [Segetibacter sp.]|nr:hypothetical protein [Segetibacter sp.]